MTKRFVNTAVLALAIAACGGAGHRGTEPPGGGGAGSGAAMVAGAAATEPVALDRVEARLLGEAAIEIGFEIEAKGAHVAAVRGDVRMTRDNQLRWRVSGTFDGSPISVDRVFDARMGAHQTEAVVLGWTRMGLLHNISRLAAAQDLEHAAGGMAEWITTTTREARPDAVTVAITVAGEAVGDATLELDSLGLPARRTQTVRFDAGEMSVEERYSVRVPTGFPADVFATH